MTVVKVLNETHVIYFKDRTVERITNQDIQIAYSGLAFCKVLILKAGGREFLFVMSTKRVFLGTVL